MNMQCVHSAMPQNIDWRKQKAARSFSANYRLRVAEIRRDYGMRERGQVPNDSHAIHDESKSFLQVALCRQID